MHLLHAGFMPARMKIAALCRIQFAREVRKEEPNGGVEELLCRIRHKPGCGMLTKIMDSRLKRKSVRALDSAHFPQSLKSSLCDGRFDPLACFGLEQRGVSSFLSIWRREVVLNGSMNVVTDRHQSSLVKLGLTNADEVLCEIHIRDA